MLAIVRRWLAGNQRAHLDRRCHLAADFDRLLIAGTLTPDTRRALQQGRADLERQIRSGLLRHSSVGV